MARTARLSYGILFALVMTAVALVIRGALDPWLHDRLPFVTVFGAVAATAWFAGWRSALVAAAVGGGASVHLWLSPGALPTDWTGLEVISLSAFVLTNVVIIAFAELAHREADRRILESARRKESEDFARITFAHAAVGMAVADPDGRLLEANARYAEILGYEPEELVGRRIVEFTHPDDVEKTRSSLSRVLAAGSGQYRIEKRYLHKQGHVIWCHVTANLMRSHADGSVRFVGVIDDISDRVRAQEALRRSEEFARSIVDNSRDCIKTLSLDGTVLWISRTGVEVLALNDPAEVIGKPWPSFWPEKDRADAQQAVQRAAAGGAGHFAAMLDRGGTTSYWSVVITPIPGPDGRPERLLAISRNLTELRRADLAVNEERRILETLNRTGALLSSQLDLQAIVQSVTDAGREISGAAFGAFFYKATGANAAAAIPYSLSSASNESYGQFPLPPDSPLFEPTFRGQGIVRIADVGADPRYESAVPRGPAQDNSALRSYLAVPVISRSGAVIGGLFFGHDRVGAFDERAERLAAGLAAQAAIAIDNAHLYEQAQRASAERQRLLESERAARARAERINAAKDDFLAILSHELRTPLGAILGWAQILRSPNVEPAHLRQGLETIERNARAQTQLIDDLLDMSRIASGKVKLELGEVMPARLVEAAVETVRPSALAKGVTLNLAIEPGLPVLRGDPARLQQVIWNLVSNAIKFTPAGGTVDVRVERRDRDVQVVVSDTGIGIAPELLSHTFERFWQADTSRTRRYGGLGLGLSICKQIVELHGGSIEARSEGAGSGAAFTVTLRADGPGITSGSERPSSVARDFVPSNLHDVPVLVVDDDDDARQLISRVLVECKAQVRTAASASEGLRVLEQFRPELVISDIGMPEMDGYEFIRHVRSRRAGAVLPAIALSAFARAEDRQDALAAGFEMHLSKPIDPNELVAMASRLVQRSGTPEIAGGGRSDRTWPSR